MSFSSADRTYSIRKAFLSQTDFVVKTESFNKVEINHIKELRVWLEVNYSQPESVWLVTYKKSIPDKYVDRWDVLDELICFGWIDGMRRKYGP